MEENPWEFNPIYTQFLAETINFLKKTLSSLSSNPLFSSIVALYILILLYFPGIFRVIVFSPVVIFTGILLLTLLRLGAVQRTEKITNQTHDSNPEEDHKWVSFESNSDPKPEMGMNLDSDPKPFYVKSFVEWNVKAPLEVIYEEYEGEDEEEKNNSNEKEERYVMGIDRYTSLSMYYPESDSDSSSGGEFPAVGGWDSPESMCFRWDEEDKDGLIEIALDGKRKTEAFHVEEDNLIEIDISPARIDEFYGES